MLNFLISMYNFVIPYESANDIPLEEFKNLHKDYWMFIYEHKRKCKPPIVSETYRSCIIDSRCFACEYSARIGEGCIKCPIYGHTDSHCIDDDGLYMKWQRTGDPKYALEIANLEWRDNDEPSSETH